VAVAGLIGVAFLVPAGYALRVDLKDRETQRISQAWELVTRPAPGNAGKGPALEYLASQSVPLIGIDLSEDFNQGSSFLMGVNLSEATLWGANFRGANLFSANLKGADMQEANLSGVELGHANLAEAELISAIFRETDLINACLKGVNLEGANLEEAKLMHANLTGAWIHGANLEGASLRDANLAEANLTFTNFKRTNLWNADLAGADLSDAENLTQAQLDGACGSEKTMLPEGLTIRHCTPPAYDSLTLEEACPAQ